MGTADEILQGSLEYPFVTALIIFTSFLSIHSIYRLTLHPLSHIPGPLLPKLTSFWLYYHAYIGDEATIIHKTHAQYGPLVRVSPNEVDIGDGDAISPIYVTRGGFPKAPCYANFDIDGHKTIFSTTDADYRSPRSKVVASMFSTRNIKDNMPALYRCVDFMVVRMKEEAAKGRPVNLLNLTRALAIDVVSTHLFQENYNGTAEKVGKLSVSPFVDAFVAVGRFFYLPNHIFVWVEWATQKIFPDDNTTASMTIVDKFVDNLVHSTPEGSQNYPGRLSSLGLGEAEIKAQCKDLIFAGTDSTGMNLATIFRQLVLHPEKYEKLRAEILSTPRELMKQDIQSLPYLSAVVKEALRISMANPTRLPRVVPAGGWTFKSVYFPAGSLVGCSAYELHFNNKIFQNPHDFLPERWLDVNTKPDANTYWFAFGAGPRACIARNLATIELCMGTERVIESDVLRGARACQDEVPILEWFNSRVKEEKVELVWEKA